MTGLKFHHKEMFDGVGKSINVLLTIFVIGLIFRMGLFIIFLFVMVLFL